MPTFTRGATSIYYEEHGTGFPILAFSPGGLPRTTIKIWSEPSAPINPITEWSKDYRVIVMDQRNTVDGQSHAPVSAKDNWDTYTSDHIALLDHLQHCLANHFDVEHSTFQLEAATHADHEPGAHG